MRLVVAMLLCASAALAHAQVGTVVSVQGSAMVQRDGKPPRVLGAGEPLEQKDVITTAQGSHAVLEFRDKTRITLRPGTVFRVDSYADTAPQGMVFGLSKGGFRAVTGEVGKQNPQAVRFQTDNVVLGIRGTEFDARLCESDCAAEDRSRPVQRVEARPAARVIELTGTATAVRGTAAPRELVAGALIDAGEHVKTGAGSYVVLAFRDGSRVTLTASSELSISRFDFDERSPSKGQAEMKLVSGQAHVWTGQLAKTSPDAFLFETTAGMLRPHGTGFTVGGNDVVIIHTWDGSVVLQTATERIELPKTATLAFTIVDGKVSFLPNPPAGFSDGSIPRPDLVNVDPSTFGRQGGDPEPGLYVWVRDGAVTLGLGGQVTELKAGSAARVGAEIRVLENIPNFMRFDLTPRPGLPANALNVNIPRFFRASDGSITRMCR